VRPLAALAAAVVLLAGCSTDEPAVAATPEAVVTGWLDALDGDADPSEFVVAGQLPLLAAIELPASADLVLAEGLSAATAAAYWDSFSDGIEAVAGATPSQLEVGGAAVLSVDGVGHGFVEVAGEGGATVVVVRGTEDGLIDMIATVGPKLIRPLANLVDWVGLDAIDGPAIAASLRAGLSDPGLDLPPEFYGEVQDLIALIDR